MKKYILLICIVILSISSILGCKATVKLGSVSGVVTLDGTPSSDITVSISGTSQSTTTNSNGSYSLTGLSAGNIILSFTKSGYSNGSTTITVVGGSDTTVPTVNLSSSYGSISGTARLEGQTDYSGLTVAISGTSSSTTTDTLGSYSFSNLAAGNVTLVFSKSGYDSTTVNATVTSAENTSVSVVTLQIAKGVITGTVNLFGESDHSGVSIYIDGSLTSYTSATNGTFIIPNLSAGTHNLTLANSAYVSYASPNVTVTAGDTTSAGTINMYREAVTQNVYNMSALTGTMLDMTYFNGYLIISTDSPKIYMISTTDASVSTSRTTTYNYEGLMETPASSLFGPGTPAALEGLYASPTGSIAETVHSTDLSVVFEYISTINISIYNAACYYQSNAVYAILYNQNYSRFDLWHNAYRRTENTFPVNETGINSMGPNSSYNAFYACNSTNIYKYTSNFSSVSARSLGTSDLVGIAFDGTNLWAIDATTKKLYKIVADL